MKWYNIKFEKQVFVKFPLSKHTYVWKRIIGVQVGNWFIGAVKGNHAEEYIK